MPTKHKVLWLALHALSTAGLLLLLLLPAHKYAWMAGMEGGTSPDVLADPAGNRLPFTLVVAGAVIALQALAAWQAQRFGHRLLSAAAVLGTAVLWLTKFGG